MSMPPGLSQTVSSPSTTIHVATNFIHPVVEPRSDHGGGDAEFNSTDALEDLDLRDFLSDSFLADYL